MDKIKLGIGIVLLIVILSNWEIGLGIVSVFVLAYIGIKILGR